MSVRRRFLSPIWLIASIPGYIGWRLLPGLTDNAVGIGVGILLLLGTCVLIPVSVANRSLKNRALADRVAWVGLILMGFLSTLFVMTLLRDLFLGVAHLALPAARVALLARPSAQWTLGLTALMTFVGLLVARRPGLVEVDVAIPNLPDALQGFTIAQISDLHVGPTIKHGFVEKIVARVNALNADVIALTGDLVDGSVADLGAHTAPLAQLSAPQGVYFVNGNHEYYSDEKSWAAEIRRLGIHVLKNQHVMLSHRGAPLLLAGVTDYTAHHFDPSEQSDPAGALRGAPRNTGPKILLAHQPSTATAAAEAGYDLQISGHTHGGQFWPWNHFIGYFQPFTRGLNHLSRLAIYVSRGTGYWGPPNRFMVPAEITRLRLVAK